jgi:hypothetical protein
MQYGDRYDRRKMALPKSLAHLKREISEKKWQEANVWAILESRIGKNIIASSASGCTRRSRRIGRNLLNPDADATAPCVRMQLATAPCVRTQLPGHMLPDEECQGICLLDAAVSGHFPSGRSRVSANGFRTTRVTASRSRWLSRLGTSQRGWFQT